MWVDYATTAILKISLLKKEIETAKRKKKERKDIKTLFPIKGFFSTDFSITYSQQSTNESGNLIGY